MLNIIFTGSWIVSNANQSLKPFGITEPQYNVLRILRGQNGEAMNLFEIQNRMLQRMSNVSRLIDKLVDKGFVERTECKENRRMVDIRITQQGLTLLTDAEATMQQNMESIIASKLTKEQAAQLADWLDAMHS
ncbi:MAG TPA: MarR family transcriptional regulator [Flavipsychrobacter sp.]|nr:MarR family transcriptional regulator [Chitinophagales bacterium]HLO70226.1 MarR family transcriptional regulator [Flavipsychrobacter sp.]